MSGIPPASSEQKEFSDIANNVPYSMEYEIADEDFCLGKYNILM